MDPPHYKSYGIQINNVILQIKLLIVRCVIKIPIEKRCSHKYISKTDNLVLNFNIVALAIVLTFAMGGYQLTYHNINDEVNHFKQKINEEN